MAFTIVIVSDEYNVECYGTFATRERAEARADKLEAQTDSDPNHDGWVKFQVCRIEPLRYFDD